MKKKALLVLAISSLIATALTALPASAATAIKSGQSCSTVNAVKRVNSKGEITRYTCMKNPFFRKNRLTWTWVECADAIKMYRDQKARNDAKVASGAALDPLEKSLEDLAKQSQPQLCQPGF